MAAKFSSRCGSSSDRLVWEGADSQISQGVTFGDCIAAFTLLNSPGFSKGESQLNLNDPGSLGADGLAEFDIG